MLPDWVDGATKWHAATLKLAADLAEEERQATAELKRIRGFRRLIDAVLERVDQQP